MKRSIRPLVFIRKRLFSSDLISPPISQPDIYLSSDQLTFYQQVEDERRREFSLPVLPRYKEALRKPLIPLDEASADEIQRFRTHLITIVDLLSQISERINETPNTGILEKLTETWGQTKKRMPDFEPSWTKDSLVSYLRLITEKKYGDRLLDSHVGIVQATVKDLLRINNPRVVFCLSVEAFKAGIVFFIRNVNVRAARELVRDMETINIIPDTDIYNVLLYANRWNIQTPGTSHIVLPWVVIQKLLEKMSSLHLSANYETWNAILMVIPIGFGKGLFLEAMQRRSIPLTTETYDRIVGDIAKSKEPKKAIEYLELQKTHSISLSTVEAVVLGLFERKMHLVGWNYLGYATKKWNLQPTTRTMNKLVTSIAQNNPRVDWVIGIAAAMKNYWGVECNAATYYNMLRCAQAAPYHRNKVDVLECIYAHMCTCQGGYFEKGEALARLAKIKSDYYSNLGFDQKRLTFSEHLTEEQVSFMEKAKNTLQWNFEESNGLIDNVHYGPRDSPRSEIARVLGVPRYQHNMQNPTFKRRVNDDLEKLVAEGQGELEKRFETYKETIKLQGPHDALYKELDRLKVGTKAAPITVHSPIDNAQRGSLFPGAAYRPTENSSANSSVDEKSESEGSEDLSQNQKAFESLLQTQRTEKIYTELTAEEERKARSIENDSISSETLIENNMKKE